MSASSPRRCLPVSLSLSALLVFTAARCAALTSTELWNAYAAAPATHPNLPDCSYAGYRYGEQPIPSPPVVADVTDFGAVGDGTFDCTSAFRAALEAAHVAGGGAVFAPAGTYRITGLLHLKYNNVVLRGAGRDVTTLDFPSSLQTLLGNFSDSGSTTSRWWWSGGFLWMGPTDTFHGNGTVNDPSPAVNQGWEYWRTGPALATVTANAAVGDTVLTVNSTAGLSPGMHVAMTWANPADASFLRHVYGHNGTAATIPGGVVGDCTWILPTQYSRFQWPVEIAAISGNTVTLRQPLRVEARTSWAVEISDPGPVVVGAGIEHLRILGHANMTHTHLVTNGALSGGWNAVYLNRTRDCWVRNVTLSGIEEGVILSAAKNTSVLDVLLDGPQQHHHSLACRVNSHDNLFARFRVDGPIRVRHGVNTEWFSSGNVWSKGFQRVGTFDTHRALSFDSIRTECTVANDTGSTPGGDAKAGPYIGKRVVHWNVLESYDGSGGFSSRNGDDVYEPRQFSMGAMVGIRGVSENITEGEVMPAGDKGTVVADHGVIPALPNLYEAQLARRLPATLTVTASGTPAEQGTVPAQFVVTRNGIVTIPLPVAYALSGTASNGADFASLPGNTTIEEGASSVSVTLSPVADDVSEGNETSTLSLIASEFYVAGSPPSATLTIRDAPQQQWRFGWFGPEANTPAVADDSADPDRDGRTNFEEYGLGLDPTAGTADGIPATDIVPVGENRYLSIEFRRRTDDPALHYAPGASEDLVGWDEVSPVQAGPAIDEGDGTETVVVRDTVPIDSADHRFLRVRLWR
jgi:hypothetical protein